MIINKKKDFLTECSETLPKELINRAKLQAEKEIFLMKLGELAKTINKEKNNSKFDNPKDLKVSKLLEYVDNLGLIVEIKVSPKKRMKNFQKELVLLKTS